MKIDTSQLTSIEIYKLILSGKLKIFPRYFWDKPDSLKEAAEITRYLIEDVLKWNEEDIKEKYDRNILMKYKLRGMFARVFNEYTFETIDNAYPNKFKPWEFNKSPQGFWNSETAKQALIWLIEEKLKWSDEDIKNNLTTEIFKQYKLCGMLQMMFNSSPYQAIQFIYPNKFKPWELKKALPWNYWNKNTAKEAMKWLIEEKLQWNIEQVKENISVNILNSNGLCSAGYIFDNKSYVEILKEIYPHEDFSMIKRGVNTKYR